MAVVLAVSPLAAVLALTGLAQAGETPTVCSVVTRRDDRGFGTLALELVGLEDDDWRERCGDFARFLNLGPPPYGTDDIETSSRLLMETGYFAHADCSLVEGDRGVSCRLTPQPMVRKAHLGGKLPFALLEQDLSRRVFLRPGVLLEQPAEQLGQQSRRLEQFLEDEGYFGSTARMSLEPGGQGLPNLGIDVRAIIDPGDSVRLREVRIEGDAQMSHDEVRDHFVHHWLFFIAQARFKPREFDDDVDTLIQTYQKRGFPEARVRGEYHVDVVNHAADIDLRIETGPRLEVVITGNENVDTEDLSKLATFAQAGVIDSVELENTTRAMREHYQREGYYDVHIEPSLDEHSTQGVLRAHFAVREGPEAEVSEVRFVGNATLKTRMLKRRGELLTEESGLLHAGRWVDTWVAHDTGAVTSVYHAQGFADAKVSAAYEHIGPDELRAVFTVTEGARRRVASVDVDGLPAEIDSAALVESLKLRRGRPYDPSALSDDERTLLTTLAREGYLHARVSREVGGGASPTGDVSVAYDIDIGPRAYFGGFLARGNLRTSKSLIDDQLKLDRGDALDLDAVGEATRRLRNLGVFTTVDLSPLGAWRRDERTWLLVAVEERDQRSVDAVASFATDELFAIGGDYRDNNLFGRAVHLDIGLRFGNASQVLWSKPRIGNVDRLQLTARVPEPWGAPFDVQLQAGYLYEDDKLFRERKVGTTIAMVRRLFQRGDCIYCPTVDASFGYDLSSTRFKAKEDLPERFDTVDDGTVARLVPELHFDRRDSFVDPRQGYAASARGELALPALALGLKGAAGFVRVINTAEAYVPLGRTGRDRLAGGSTLGGPVVLAFGGQYGALQRLRNAPGIPASETFAYGGDASVRGLRDRASAVGDFGARYLAVLSAEARWYFWQDVSIGTFQVAAFADLGTVADERRSLFQDITLSVGPVLRYVTPVGPISLAYGKPVVRAPGIGSAGRLHFSFGYSY